MSAGAGVGSGARADAGLPVLVLDLHHVWDYFRSKFALRRLAEYRDCLAVADEIAWACYREPLAAALAAGTVAAKEPPLVSFSRAAAPRAHRRGGQYRELLPRGGIHTAAGLRLVRSLPFPVIDVPWYYGAHLPGLLTVAHETGHHIEDDFGLTPEIQARLAAAGLPGDELPDWQRWAGEVFADVCACLACGVAYPGVLAELLGTLGSPGAARPSGAVRSAEGARSSEAARLLDETRPSEGARSPDAAGSSEGARFSGAARSSDVARSSDAARPSEGARSPDAARPAEGARFPGAARSSDVARSSDAAQSPEAARPSERAWSSEGPRSPDAARPPDHPPTGIRLAVCLAVLERAGHPPAAARPKPLVDLLAGEVTDTPAADAVARALLDGGYGRLGGKSLVDLLAPQRPEPGAPREYPDQTHAGRLLAGMPSRHPRIPGVVAAAALAFLTDPAGYDDLRVGARATAEALALRPVGPRADVPGNAPDTAQRDAEAGHLLLGALHGEA
ncbi:hypothetical protein AB0B50_10040 [Streptomyces sp. NPDC041068]|uniref:hypothetical protein n=1 Tax=Streptomyces sp. NPDC041068 TaxID=3155130 RepID=UPI0034069BFC